jgi:GT2 family glycosyltransferase
VVTWTGEFNYSSINNYGVGFARGEYLLLLNNDTEIINEDCLSQMLGYCQRDDVGIVGARLYYPDGSLQHAGVIIGMGGIAGHIFAGLDESLGTYQSRSRISCDYSAVTAACMMVKKRIFEQVGGLEEGFQVAFNDVDFCLRVRQTGALVVYNANATLYHYESKSRGLDDTPEKAARFQREVDLFRSRWGDFMEKGDPYYNPNLALDKGDCSIRM